MKNILACIGTPRKKGHTHFLLDQVLAGAREAGAQVEKIDLTRLNIAPCQECFACQESEEFRCAVEDDMQNLYDKINVAEELIMASPVFFFGPSAQIKPFIDRYFAMIKIDTKTGKFTSSLAGKGLSLVTTCFGDPFDGADLLVSMCRRIAAFTSMNFRGSVLAYSFSTLEELEKNKAILEQAWQFGKLLAQK